jgi:hypothetical protein
MKIIESERFRSLKAGGCTHKNEYYLHPRAFKICLMRSLKTKKYAKYYLLLEESIKYFNEYQIELKNKYNLSLENKIKEKNTKINTLEEKLDNIISDNKKLLKDNDEMKKMLDKTFNKLVGAHEEIRDIKDKLDNTTEELDVIKDKLDIATDDRVIKTKSKTTDI